MRRVFSICIVMIPLIVFVFLLSYFFIPHSSWGPTSSVNTKKSLGTENKNPLISDESKILLNENAISSEKNNLIAVYKNYVDAVNTRNLEQLDQYLALKNITNIKEQLKSEKNGELFWTFQHKDFVAETTFGAGIVEADKGVLRVEEFGKASLSMPGKPSAEKVRQYSTVFFVKENDVWKISKIMSQEEQDYTGVFSAPRPDPELFPYPPSFWSATFHANHTIDATDCATIKFGKNECYANWAIINLDSSLCALITNATGQLQCYQDMAGLTGDQSLCAIIPSGMEVSTFFNDESVKNITGMCQSSATQLKNFIAVDLYKLDSDGDGLPDLQERYFGTSITHFDTDGDGASDAQEVINDTNALSAIGRGRLGDQWK